MSPSLPWQQKLLDWYQRHRRDLPWRRTRDPYAIWVSEVMLQQTTVEAVIPYYQRFLKRFPTIQRLAEADYQDVLTQWSGLGYYSRARNLHRAAQQVMEDHQGKMPQEVDQLQKLTGIGRYTAGAIASIAFDQPVSVLDGNVMRVLSRVFRLKQDPKSAAGQGHFWEVSTQALQGLIKNSSQASPGDFNQALMELGATVCTPEAPGCLICPLRGPCQAQAQDDPETYPRIQKKIRYVDVQMSAALIRQRGKLLILQRPQSGLLKGMWEFPMVEGDQQDLVKKFPLEGFQALVMVRHSVLNKRIRITPYVCRWSDPEQLKKWDQPYQWIRPQELGCVPASSMNRKILASYLKTVLNLRFSD